MSYIKKLEKDYNDSLISHIKLSQLREKYLALSEEEKNSVVDSIKEITVQSATKSEEKIERAIAKQLASGTIPDANGDGIADSADVEAYKAELLGLKKSITSPTKIPLSKTTASPGSI